MAELIYKRNTKKSKKNIVITASATITSPRCFIYYQFIQHSEKYAIRKSAGAVALSSF